MFLIDELIWLTVVAALVWLAVIYFPELKEAVRSLPALAHQALHDVETWWNHH